MYHPEDIRLFSFYTINKTILCRGEVLKTVLGIEKRSVRAILVLTYEGKEDAVESRGKGQSDGAGDRIVELRTLDDEYGHLRVIELDTSELLQGSYTLEFTIGEAEHVEVPEIITVLDPLNYKKVVLAEAEEPFLPSPPLRGAAEVYRFVESVTYDATRRDLRASVRGGRRRPVRGLWTPDGLLEEDVRERDYPSAPIAWTTNIVVNVVRNICFFGYNYLSWHVVLRDERFGLRGWGAPYGGISKLFAATLEDEIYNPLLPFRHAGLKLTEQSLIFRNNSFEFFVEHSISEFGMCLNQNFGDLRPLRSRDARDDKSVRVHDTIEGFTISGDARSANLGLVQRMYECFNRDDLDTIRREIFATDLVWNLPGHHPLAGTKHGAEEVFAFFAQLRQANIQVTIDPQNDPDTGIDSFGESGVVEVNRGRGTTTVRDASGSETQVILNALNCIHYHIRGGRIANVQVYMSDQHAADTFFNAAYKLAPIPDRLA